MVENPSPASALIGDPSTFGRVGEDGTVYLITESGERAVGSYPGKSPEEALAYFVRKFEMLASEVALLGARISSGAILPDEALIAIGKIRHQFENFNGVGNLAALKASLEQLPTLIENNKEVYELKKAAEKEAREAKRLETLAIKEKIVVEVESLTESQSWKSTSERLKELMDQWKKAPRLDKATDTLLWKRFSSSRNKFDKRRRLHFAQLVAKQGEVKTVKEKIIEEAEALATSTDWVKTARRYKELMDQWKAAGRGKHGDDAKLWLKFKTAQDSFFTLKNADLERRNQSMQSNLVKREALLKEFELLIPFTDHQIARKKFRDLDDQWRKLGITDRKRREALENRIKIVNDAIGVAEENHARKSDPTARARAQDVVNQLQDAVNSYQAGARKAQDAGNSKKAQELLEAAEARKTWLAEAEKSLAEFSS